MHWLLRFVRTDLADISDATLLALRMEAVRFPGAVIPEYEEGEFEPDGPGGYPLPSRDVLRSIQRQYHAGMARLARGDWWMLEKPLRYGIARAGERILMGSERGPFHDLFIAGAMSLIQEYWPQLYSCPQCHAVFLKEGKQQYCSPECSRRKRWARYQANRPDRDYRNERERAVRRKLGPRVRVGRRKQQSG